MLGATQYHKHACTSVHTQTQSTANVNLICGQNLPNSLIVSKDAKAIIHGTHGLLDISRRFNSVLRQKRISERGNTLRTMWPLINSARLRKVGTTAAIALRQTTLVQRHMSHTPPPTARYYQAVTVKKEAARAHMLPKCIRYAHPCDGICFACIDTDTSS